MTINEMIAKRKTLLDTMDGFLDTHKNENGTLSKEDDAAYAEMEVKFKNLTTEIQRMQRREEMENEMRKPSICKLGFCTRSFRFAYTE